MPQKYNAQQQALHDLKNKARGALSANQNKAPATSSSSLIARERKATAAIKLILATARKNLTGPTLRHFEEWLVNQESTTKTDTKLGAPRELLGLIPESIEIPTLHEALKSTKHHLARYSEKLLELVNLAFAIDKNIKLHNYSKAENLIDELLAGQGYSFWAIETKIALLSSLNKPSKVKEYIENLSTGSVGLNSFYLYYFSLRNEASQSSQRLRSIVNKKVKDSSLPNGYQAYAEYRAARTIPKHKDGLSAILAHEQYTTPIDLYFTARRICNEVLLHPREFDDEAKLLAEQIIALTSSSQKAPSQWENIPQDLNNIIDSGVDDALLSNAPLTDSTFNAQLTKGLSAAMSFSGNEAHEEDLRKALMNYWWLEEVAILDTCYPPPKLPELFLEPANSSRTSANPVLARIRARLALHEPAISKLSPEFICIDYQSFESLAKARTPDSIIDCLFVKAAWTHFEEDNYSQLFKTIQLALFHNPRLLNSLPLDRLFNGVEYRKIRSYGISIDLCNCLHWYSQINNDRKIRTFKRFAIEEWVEHCSCNSLVEASRALVNKSGNNQIAEYFLTNTCDNATIELLLEIDSTRQAMEVRATLLRLAAEFSKSSAQLNAEADTIASQLQVDDVLEELDETKVSVDESALLPVVAREVSTDFERYKQLIEKSPAHGSSVEELLKSLRQQSASAFQIPKSEADDLLIQMIQAVLDRFIDDSVYGLDAIMGRRIRHGTISDELRGTLEHLHLIGQRPRTGADYELPGKVTSIIANYETSSRKGIHRAFSKFSSAIDSLAAQLRDELFQCKPKGKLKPAFELTLSPVLFAMARDAASISGNSEQFCRELFDAFWFLLSTRAEHERIEAKQFIGSALRDSCTKLIADLRGAKVSEAQFLSAIQQASEELQNRAKTISNWISIPKSSFEGRSYPIGLVSDAAMVFCKTKRPGFEPTLTEEIDRSINLDAHGYPIVFDALCIAYSNIAQHSGIKQGNRVHTKIQLNKDGNLLTFLIESEIAKDHWNRERLQRIEAISEEINKRNFADRAKRTSGSGLAKLATIVQQRQNCKIEFGAIENNTRFRLCFDLSYIPLGCSDANANSVNLRPSLALP